MIRGRRFAASTLALAMASGLSAPAFAQGTGNAPAPAPAAGNPSAPKSPSAAPAVDEKPLPPDTVLATVNGKKITQLDVTMAAEDLGSNISQQLKGKARDAYLLDYLIDGALVSEKAKADKLDQTPEFGKKVDYAKDKILMESLLTVIAKSATSNAALHAIYDQAAKAQKPEEEIRARHVLVATEADAQAALKRLKSGEDFGKVAKEVSKDPGSEGGELGWFTKERMVPAFADAAFKLQPGQYSDPIKTQFGWHIIQVEGRRQKTFPPFDQVKDQLVRYAIQKAQSDLIIELRKGAKIERTAAAPPAPELTPSDAGDQAK